MPASSSIKVASNSVINQLLILSWCIMTLDVLSVINVATFMVNNTSLTGPLYISVYPNAVGCLPVIASQALNDVYSNSAQLK